jgi:hypothetical protein
MFLSTLFIPTAPQTKILEDRTNRAKLSTHALQNQNVCSQLNYTVWRTKNIYVPSLSSGCEIAPFLFATSLPKRRFLEGRTNTYAPQTTILEAGTKDEIRILSLPNEDLGRMNKR